MQCGAMAIEVRMGWVLYYDQIESDLIVVISTGPLHTLWSATWSDEPSWRWHHDVCKIPRVPGLLNLIPSLIDICLCSFSSSASKVHTNTKHTLDSVFY